MIKSLIILRSILVINDKDIYKYNKFSETDNRKSCEDCPLFKTSCSITDNVCSAPLCLYNSVRNIVSNNKKVYNIKNNTIIRIKEVSSFYNESKDEYYSHIFKISSLNKGDISLFESSKLRYIKYEKRNSKTK